MDHKNINRRYVMDQKDNFNEGHNSLVFHLYNMIYKCHWFIYSMITIIQYQVDYKIMKVKFRSKQRKIL